MEGEENVVCYTRIDDRKIWYQSEYENKWRNEILLLLPTMLMRMNVINNNRMIKRERT